MTPITLAAGLRPGPVTLRAAVHWQECSELCVLAEAEPPSQLDCATETKPSADAALIELWRKKVPPPAAPDAATAFWESSRFQSNSRPVVIQWKTGAAPADFYPDADTNFSVEGMTETLKSGDGGVRLRKMVTKNGAGWPDHISGVLAGRPDAAQPAAVDTVLAIQPAPANAPRTDAAPISVGALVTMLCFAFLGGLILNVMPCVLPVIALKILGFVKQSAERPGGCATWGWSMASAFWFLPDPGRTGHRRAAGGRTGQLGRRHPRSPCAAGADGFGHVGRAESLRRFRGNTWLARHGAASELAARQGFSGAFSTACWRRPGHALHGAFPGRGAGFRLHPAGLDHHPGFSGGGRGIRFPVCPAVRATPLDEPAAQTRRVDGEIQSGDGLSHARHRPLADVGLRQATSRTFYGWRFSWRAGVGGSGFGANSSNAPPAARDWRRQFASPCWRWAAPFLLGDHSDQITWQTWSAGAVLAAQQAGHPVLVDFTAESCLTCQVNKGRAWRLTAPAPSSSKSAPWHSWAISRGKTRPSRGNCGATSGRRAVGAGLFQGHQPAAGSAVHLSPHAIHRPTALEKAGR